MFPDHLVIIGGGRWARVYIETVINILPSDTLISINTEKNVKGMNVWAEKLCLQNRLKISNKLPDLKKNKNNAVIISNAAKDHARFVKWGIEKKAKILVEKPLALNFNIASQLVELAKKDNVYLASAHVFNFSESIKSLKNLLGKDDSIKSISITWSDCTSEIRYGDKKTFDPSLTVLEDVFPHIFSIFNVITKLKKWTYKPGNLKFLRGGSKLKASLLINNILCSFEVMRNSKARKRIIKIYSNRGFIKLNFSGEKDIFSSDYLKNNLKNTGGVGSLSRMISYFFKYSTHQKVKNLLDVRESLLAIKIIECISVDYYLSKYRWLAKEILKNDKKNINISYALREMIEKRKTNSNLITAKIIYSIHVLIKREIFSLKNSIKLNKVENFFDSILDRNKLDLYL